MLDIFALTGLEWLYDSVEARYGRGVALFVTFATALALVGVLTWVLLSILGR